MFRAAAIMIAWLAESELSKSLQPCFVYNHCYAPLTYKGGVHKTAYITADAGRPGESARFQPQSSNSNFELELLSSLSPFPVVYYSRRSSAAS